MKAMKSGIGLAMVMCVAIQFAGNEVFGYFDSSEPVIGGFVSRAKAEDLERVLATRAPGSPSRQIELKIFSQKGYWQPYREPARYDYGFGVTVKKEALTADEAECAAQQTKELRAALEADPKRSEFLNRIPIDRIELYVGTDNGSLAVFKNGAGFNNGPVNHGVEITDDPILRLYALRYIRTQWSPQSNQETVVRNFCRVSTAQQLGEFFDNLMNPVEDLHAISEMIRSNGKPGQKAVDSGSASVSSEARGKSGASAAGWSRQDDVDARAFNAN